MSPSSPQGLRQNVILHGMLPSWSEDRHDPKETELRAILEDTEMKVYGKYHKKYTVLICARLPFPCPLRGAAGERRRMQRGAITEVTRPHQSPDSIHTMSPPCRDYNDALATVVRPVDGEQTITSYDHDDHIYDDHTTMPRMTMVPLTAMSCRRLEHDVATTPCLTGVLRPSRHPREVRVHTS